MRCAKVRYSDHEQATNALRHIKNSPNEGDKPKRAYFCEDCKGYHLTKSDMVGNVSGNTWLKFFDAWRALIT